MGSKRMCKKPPLEVTQKADAIGPRSSGVEKNWTL
jgi:hypothetical protein